MKSGSWKAYPLERAIGALWLLYSLGSLVLVLSKSHAWTQSAIMILATTAGLKVLAAFLVAAGVRIGYALFFLSTLLVVLDAWRTYAMFGLPIQVVPVVGAMFLTGVWLLARSLGWRPFG